MLDKIVTGGGRGDPGLHHQLDMIRMLGILRQIPSSDRLTASKVLHRY